jgi:hypothetical protein
MFWPGPMLASYSPVVMASFVGAQTGEVEKALRYSKPSRASRSIVGVRASGSP